MREKNSIFLTNFLSNHRKSPTFFQKCPRPNSAWIELYSWWRIMWVLDTLCFSQTQQRLGNWKPLYFKSIFHNQSTWRIFQTWRDFLGGNDLEKINFPNKPHYEHHKEAQAPPQIEPELFPKRMPKPRPKRSLCSLLGKRAQALENGKGQKKKKK